jgi:cysteine desulfurase
MKIYLDNAATTPLDKTVFEAMTPYLLQHFGNPSSHHHFGREARSAINCCRDTIAQLINAKPHEITFTSGGTEADNMAILSAVKANGIKNVITDKFEHHAVLHTLQGLQKNGEITLSYIKHDCNGNLDLEHLEELLADSPRSLVSVMHANNEIGNLNDIEKIASICKKYNALFHTDTVQTIGHYSYDLQKLNVHFLTASAHKFHGPKGVGFLYCRDGVQLSPLICGGGQENRLRAGTENIAGIVGLTKALELAYTDLDEHREHITGLKTRLISHLIERLPGIAFNGNSDNIEKSLYTVLSVSLPNTGQNLLRYFDEQGIAVSGGSACSTGSASHVLSALGVDPGRDTIRFSFSKFNRSEEIDLVAEILADVFGQVAA